MRVPSAVLVVSLAAVVPQTPAPVDARKASLADATLVTTIDTGKLKGEPTQLGWSPDGSQLYLQLSQRGSDGLFVKPRVVLLSTASPQPQSVDAPPAWTTEYWSWKSDKTGPGTGSPEIELQTEEKNSSETQSAMGGSTYGGGGVDAVSGTSIEGARRQAEQAQKQRIITLTLSGQTIGRFVNQPLLPGYTFGWAPKAVGLLAYVNDAGHLAVMDMRGGHQDLAASKNVILPAWSPDGSTIAYLQKAGRNTYELYTVHISAGS